MINTNLIKQIMGKFPDFKYQLNPIENNIELIIEKTSWISYGDGSCIRKVLSEDDDLSLLEEVLKEKAHV